MGISAAAFSEWVAGTPECETAREPRRFEVPRCESCSGAWWQGGACVECGASRDARICVDLHADELSAEDWAFLTDDEHAAARAELIAEGGAAPAPRRELALVRCAVVVDESDEAVGF